MIDRWCFCIVRWTFLLYSFMPRDVFAADGGVAGLEAWTDLIR